MPRPHRIQLAGAIYHVMARGVNRARIFVDDEDYRTYTRLLAMAVERFGWTLFAYSLMPNHVHLVIQTPEPNIALGMHWLQSQYARAFNDRHVRLGPLYQARYKSPLVKTDEAFVRLIGYVVANPVAAKLAKRPEDWPWGSHPKVAGGRRPPRWLAHEALNDHLEGITGARCYDRLVKTYCRERY